MTSDLFITDLGDGVTGHVPAPRTRETLPVGEADDDPTTLAIGEEGDDGEDGEEDDEQ
jgi:hypothetical protein